MYYNRLDASICVVLKLGIGGSPLWKKHLFQLQLSCTIVIKSELCLVKLTQLQNNNIKPVTSCFNICPAIYDA